MSINDNNNTKKESNLNSINNEDNKMTPIKNSNISLGDNSNEIEINKENNNINNLIQNPNKIRKLNSTEKLEQKIKDLESKLDDLNNNTISFFNTTEEEEENNDDKYLILNKPGLSEISKEYLSINLDDLEPKNELSDFTRAYMIELHNYDNVDNERPELSGLTKKFLKDNKEIKTYKGKIQISNFSALFDFNVKFFMDKIFGSEVISFSLKSYS